MDQSTDRLAPHSKSVARQLTRTTLVTGLATRKREDAILANVQAELATATPAAVRTNEIAGAASSRFAVILEGLPDGHDHFQQHSSVSATRIAAACPCCLGNLTMRVTLNRVLRHPPQVLYISLASHTHLEQFRAFLTSPPYDAWLELTEDLLAE